MIHLIQNWFTSENEDRNKDFFHCLAMNIKNEYITNITMLCEHELNIENNKIKKIKYKKAKVKDCLACVDKNKINIIANLDIYFDETIRYSKSIKDKECYALSRYDLIDKNLVPFHRQDSQDSWVFRSKETECIGDYHFGLPGFDNRLCFELSKYYRITNPCKTIRSVHVHCNGSRWPNKRTYRKEDRITGNYFYVEPTRLNKFF